MKKILIAFLFFIFSFSCVSINVNALSFEEAPTLNDYVSKRGKDKLEYVIFAIARLRFGATAKDWDQIEKDGTRLLQDYSHEQLAEFLFKNTYSYKLTKTAYEIIVDSLKSDNAVVDKDYFDSFGNYKPLNASSIVIRRDIYVDIANLFNANTLMSTTRPLDNGYEYNYNTLLFNNLEMTVTNNNVLAKRLDFEIVSNPDRSSGSYMPYTGQTGNKFYYLVMSSGASSDYSYVKVTGDYESSLTELNNLTNLEITFRIGDMTKVVKGSGTISQDIEIDKVYNIDPSKPIMDSNGEEGEGEENEEGENGNWWDWLTKIWNWITNVLSGFLDSVLDFFEWIKDFFIPDFSNFSSRLNELVDLFKSKFSSIFDLVDMFKNLFASSKSLHDLRYVVNGADFYPFPIKQTEEPFKLLKAILNVAIVLITLIRCYKRIVGEGDVIE